MTERRLTLGLGRLRIPAAAGNTERSYREQDHEELWEFHVLLIPPFKIMRERAVDASLYLTTRAYSQRWGCEGSPAILMVAAMHSPKPNPDTKTGHPEERF